MLCVDIADIGVRVDHQIEACRAVPAEVADGGDGISVVREDSDAEAVGVAGALQKIPVVISKGVLAQLGRAEELHSLWLKKLITV